MGVLLARRGSHHVFFGAVVQDPDAHLLIVGSGKFLDADGIEGRAEPGFRVQAQVLRFHPASVFRHFYHPGNSMP